MEKIKDKFFLYGYEITCTFYVFDNNYALGRIMPTPPFQNVHILILCTSENVRWVAKKKQDCQSNDCQA